MSLSLEDKAIISEYMEWGEYEDEYCRGMFPFDTIIHFDLNDAALCVVKMMEKGDWDVFYQNGMGQYALIDGRSGIKQQDYVAWLFNSQNFFAAMAAWLRSK